MVTRAVVASAREQGDWLQVWIASTFVILTFGAFAPTYFVPIGAGRFDGPPILHLHATLFFAWTVLFLVQSALAASNRYRWHRALGRFGIALATSMVFVGLAAISSSMISWQARGFEDEARAFSIIAFSGAAMFVTFVIAAIANVHRPDHHKRLMLLATLSIMQASSGRLAFNVVNTVPFARPGTLEPVAPELGMVPHLAFDVVVLGIVMTYDWRTRGRPHPVYVVGGGLMILVHATRHLFVDTAIWRSLLDLFIAFAR